MKAHVLKVALSHSKKVFRKIAILGDQSLDELHGVIFSAFDRYDEHLYSFFLPEKPTRSERAIWQSDQFCHPMAMDEYDEIPNKYDASAVSIDSLGLGVKQKFYYLFDYGDSWWHEITYEGVTACDVDACPAVILVNGASPDQYPNFEEEEE